MRGRAAPRRTARPARRRRRARARARAAASASQPSGSRAHTNIPPSGRLWTEPGGARRRGRQAARRAARRRPAQNARCGASRSTPRASALRRPDRRSTSAGRRPAWRRRAAGAAPRRAHPADPQPRERRPWRACERASTRSSAPGQRGQRGHRLAAVAQLAVGVVLDQPQPARARASTSASRRSSGERPARRVLERRDGVEQLRIVLLIDERPEEVTDMQRSVKGEAISSTFDEPAQRHVQVAEMVIKKPSASWSTGRMSSSCSIPLRAWRGLQHIVPASGKVLSGGVDSNALQRPKSFFGAARNIEEGGSQLSSRPPWSTRLARWTK